MNQEGTQIAICGRLEKDDTIKRSIVRSDCLLKGETAEIQISRSRSWVLVQGRGLGISIYRLLLCLSPQLVLHITCIVIQSLLLDSLSDLSLTSFLSQGHPPRRLLWTCHLTQASPVSCLCAITPESDRTSMCPRTTLECALLERSVIMQPA